MGKHRHTKDKMYVTFTEQQTEWEGKKAGNEKIPFSLLPYFCCSLGLAPFQSPVCSPEGIIYDLINIIPYIKKYKICPVTGNSLKVNELIKLNFYQNDKGEYQDPISFKPFTDHSHIVAIKVSGNVYSFDTVDELNKKSKYWKDLISGQNFSFKDIITLQDPKNLKNRTIQDFNYIKEKKLIYVALKDESIDNFINQNQSTKKVIQQLEEKQKQQEEIKADVQQKENEQKQKMDIKQKSLEEEVSVKEFIEYCVKNKIYMHERQTTNNDAISVTSTFNNSYTKGVIEYRCLNENEVRKKIYDEIKTKQIKGYVTLKTNVGDINLKLHSNWAVKTCENFIELCESKYYNNTKFHRLIKDFMVQGGDPTGTGTGGQSIFGKEFEDEFHSKLSHDKPGIISMANNKRDGNGSQFFITLADCPHLNNKHTVFGEVIDGQSVLFKINKIPTKQNDKPAQPILIEEAIVRDNPYRKQINILRKELLLEEKKKIQDQFKEERQKLRWIDKSEQFTLDGINLNACDDDELEQMDKKKKKQKTDQQNLKPLQKIQKAGILDSILDFQQPPVHYQKQQSLQRKNFDFNQW